MKKLILKSSSLLILTFILSLTLLLFVPVEQSYAQENKPIKFTPQVDIPGGIEGETLVGSRGKTTLLSRYIAGVYNYSFAVAGILAAIVLMGGGLLWLVSGGSQTKVSQAKDIIGGSIIGLGILFSAYLLLNTINPALLENKALEIENIGAAPDDSTRFGCCQCELSGMYDNWSFKTEKNEKKLTTCEASQGLTQEMCQEICKKNKDENQADKSNPPIFVVNAKCGATSFDEKGSYRICEPLEDAGSEVTENGFVVGNWSFQTGIENQIPDMSGELVSFLNCMRKELDNQTLYNVGEISSISQTGYDANSGECNQQSCPGKPTCVHACESCHYGGGLDTNKSYAVDFGDETNSMYLTKAANKCDPNPYIKDEGSHIHISVSKCPKY